ncbi:hypothetical protein [Mycobacterium aquaticum]|uniref:HNH endonuclease n=1 Tax=Mycobacterium aquaticum TaxID=1927124 RepID=A0A1X0A4S9_9MYCO|nr:hypothetical protein [Mycobacterium aquaticum]ORA24878.1 hypothetical protein BST13_33415 [Mycobacterium aquaticum]
MPNDKRQRSAICGTCKGELRYYPQPAVDGVETDTESNWAHLDPHDWLTNPHPPTPQESNPE